MKNQYLWLGLIVLIGLVLRLYKIEAPIADWHSWRQADTAAVTRNFVKEGFNPFFPKYDDMSNVSSNSVTNPGRFRFVEFPIYNILVYPFYLIFGVHDLYSRLVSVLISLGSIVFIFLIVRRYTDILTAHIAAFIFAVLPFNVFFSRTALPEPTLVFFSLGMVYFVDRWIGEGTRNTYLAALAFTIIAFLIKPWAVFFVPPLIYIAFKKQGKIFPINKRFIAFAFAGTIPFILWRLWILNFPEGIPASDWLLNGDGIRFRPAFWWWIVSERLGGEILGVTGFLLMVLGALLKPKNGNYFLHVWLLSAFAYLAIFATGNVRHNYYQATIIPILAIFTAIGVRSLLIGIPGFIARIWTIPLCLLLVFLNIYFTFKLDKEFYKVNNPAIVAAGQRADQILPKNAIVLAPYNGDTAFLYQINRAGFAVEVLPLTELISSFGVSAYVSTTKDSKTNWVMRHFNVLEDNPDFVIVDLTKINIPIDSGDPEP